MPDLGITCPCGFRMRITQAPSSIAVQALATFFDQHVCVFTDAITFDLHPEGNEK